MANRHLLSMYKKTIMIRSLSPWEVTKRVWEAKGRKCGYSTEIGLYLAIVKLLNGKNLSDDVAEKLTQNLGSAL